MLFFFFTQLCLVSERNWIMNGDAETGPCASDSSVVSPTGWNHNGTVTQVYYNNPSSSQLTTDPGPRWDIKLDIWSDEAFVFLVIVVIVISMVKSVLRQQGGKNETWQVMFILSLIMKLFGSIFQPGSVVIAIKMIMLKHCWCFSINQTKWLVILRPLDQCERQIVVI